MKISLFLNFFAIATLEFLIIANIPSFSSIIESFPPQILLLFNLKYILSPRLWIEGLFNDKTLIAYKQLVYRQIFWLH